MGCQGSKPQLGEEDKGEVKTMAGDCCSSDMVSFQSSSKKRDDPSPSISNSTRNTDDRGQPTLPSAANSGGGSTRQQLPAVPVRRESNATLSTDKLASSPHPIPTRRQSAEVPIF